MKKKNKIRLVAIATTAALVGGLLIMPIWAAESSSKEPDMEIEMDICPHCHEWMGSDMDKWSEHINNCLENPVNFWSV